ncbi:MAG: polysaccharide deacetylase family protein [Acidobacteria bacterium]|nr:polysaccharide deacetylase family protein [Acidobacteriota bacterium]
MKARVLMYHDVVETGRDEASGFPGADAAAYKLETTQFAAHLKAIAAATPSERPAIASDLLRGEANSTPWLITFDDGGASAHTHVAGMLEELGWRGHFFITTNYVGAPAFMTATQLRDLHTRGHVVGSHSCSHPLKMSRCSPAEILREWRESSNALSDILGEPVDTASVPGGFYSERVAAAAAEAGFKVLFTSEPAARTREVRGCLIAGRYSIQRHTAPRVAAGLVAGQLAPALRQSLTWNAKKVLKSLGGEAWFKFRKSVLERRAASLSERRRKDEG